jgi:S1 RNA binding domain protein
MDPPPRPAAAGTSAGAVRSSAPGGDKRPAGFSQRSPSSREPTDFEDKLKQIMQSSDSKLSDLRMMEKRNSRRGNRSK